MTHGIDTDFLVAAEIREHPFHRGCNVCSVKGFSRGRQAPSGAAA